MLSPACCTGGELRASFLREQVLQVGLARRTAPASQPRRFSSRAPDPAVRPPPNVSGSLSTTLPPASTSPLPCSLLPSHSSLCSGPIPLLVPHQRLPWTSCFQPPQPSLAHCVGKKTAICEHVLLLPFITYHKHSPFYNAFFLS